MVSMPYINVLYGWTQVSLLVEYNHSRGVNAFYVSCLYSCLLFHVK